MQYFATIIARVERPLELGGMRDGRRRIIPISGGELVGPLGNGEILPGGADFQVIRSGTATELLAKYAIRMEDGEHITIDNFGLRTASPEDTEALAQGRPVPADRVYFRCVPRLSGSGAWSWIDDRIFVGTGRRHPDRVEVEVFELL